MSLRSRIRIDMTMGRDESRVRPDCALAGPATSRGTGDLSPRRVRIVRHAALAVVAALVAGLIPAVVSRAADSPPPLPPSSPTRSSKGTYLGIQNGLTIGVVTDDHRVRVFAARHGAAAWYETTLHGNSFDVTGADGSRVAGAVAAGRAQGRYIGADGVTEIFDVPAPTQDGGLFRSRVMTDTRLIDAGWVATDDGQVGGSVIETDGGRGRTVKAGPAVTAAQLRAAGAVKLGSGRSVPVHEIVPAALAAPLPTASLPSSATNQNPSPTEPTTLDKNIKVTSLAERPAPGKGAEAIVATLELSQNRVSTLKSVEATLTLSNPDDQPATHVEVEVGLPAGLSSLPLRDAEMSNCLRTEGTSFDVVALGPGDSQVFGRGVALGAGESCVLRMVLRPTKARAYEIVTGAPRAAGRPDGAPAVALLTAFPTGSIPPAPLSPAPPEDPKPTTAPVAGVSGSAVVVPAKGPQFSLPAGLPGSDAGQPNGVAVTADVTIGYSPLPVRLAPTNIPARANWALVFSDGSPAVSGRGTPPAVIPHTFVHSVGENDPPEPVVHTAELTVFDGAKKIGPMRVHVEVHPLAKTGRIGAGITVRSEAFMRGTTSSVNLDVFNPGRTGVDGLPIVNVVVSPSLPFTVVPTGTGWTCDTPSRCMLSAPLSALATPPPLRVDVEVPPDAAPSYKVSTRVLVNGRLAKSRSASVPVDGVIAKAGDDQRLPNLLDVGTPEERKTPVTLDGRQTLRGSRPATFSWSQVTGPVVVLRNPTDAVASFDAPVVQTPTALTFRLDVSDGRSTSSDEVVVMIDPINRPPKVSVSAPFTAGMWITPSTFIPARGTSRVILVLSRSDPDKDKTQHGWIVETDAAKPFAEVNRGTLSLPWPISGTPEVVLVATAMDSRGLETRRTITVGRSPKALSVTATGPAAAAPGGVVEVTATPSKAAAVAWRQVGGPTAKITNPAARTTDISLPPGAAPGSVVELLVTASATNVADATARVEITLLPDPDPVALQVAPAQSVSPGSTVTVSAVAIGAAATGVRWTQLSGPDIGPLPESLTVSFTAPAAGTVALRVDATAGGRAVSATHRAVVEESADACPTVTTALDGFPAIPLPGGFALTEGTATVDCNGNTHLDATATGAEGGSITLDGDRSADGRLVANIGVHDLRVFGGTVNTGGTDAGYDSSTGELALAIDQPDLGIAGLHLSSATLVLSEAGISVQAQGLVGAGDAAIGVSIEGAIESLDRFNLLATASRAGGSAGPVSLGPALHVDAAAVTGFVERNGNGVQFRLVASVAGAWQPAEGVTVTGAQVEIGNAAPRPAVCDGAPEGIHIAATGTASLNVPSLDQPIALAAEACLGLPGATGAGPDGSLPFFALATTAVSEWRPLNGVDLVVRQAALSVTYDGVTLKARITGQARVLAVDPLTLVVEIEADPDGTLKALFVVSGDLSGIGIPVPGAAFAIASDDFDDYVIPGFSGAVDIGRGITAVAEADLDPGLVEKLAALGLDVPQAITLTANFTGSSINLQATLDLDVTLLRVCERGIYSDCDGHENATTELAIDDLALGVTIGTEVRVTMTANGTLMLPKQNRSGRDSLDVGVSVFVAPPAEIGFSLFLDGAWTNPFGIDGVTVHKFAAQVSLDFTVPTAPIPSFGFLLEVSIDGGPLAEVLKIQQPAEGDPESIRIAANISKSAPIFELTVGTRNGHMLVRPHDQLQIDAVSVVFAPLGGSIGPFTYEPGVSVSFGAKVFSVKVDALLEIDLDALTMTGNLTVGRVQVGPLTLDDTTLAIDLGPDRFCGAATGGARLGGNGPRLSATISFKAGGSSCGVPDDPASTFDDPGSAGFSARARLTASRWQVAPGVRLDNLELDGSVTGTSVAFGLTTSVNVLGQSREFSGSVAVSDGVLQRIELIARPGTFSVGPLVFGGDEIPCPTRDDDEPAGDGPCLVVDYNRLASPALHVAARGEVSVAGTGTTIAVDAVLDSHHAAIEGRVVSGALTGLELAGELHHAPTVQSRILDGEGQMVAASPGDFRLSGRFDSAVSLAGASARWQFALGRAGGTDSYLQGSADLEVLGARVHVEGNAYSNSDGLHFAFLGEGQVQVDTRRYRLSGVEDEIVRPVAVAANEATVTHAGEEGLVTKLGGRAAFRFRVRVDSDTSPALRVSGHGTATLSYIEAPGGREEARSAWTTLAGLRVDFDSETQRFCYYGNVGGFDYQMPSGCRD